MSNIPEHLRAATEAELKAVVATLRERYPDMLLLFRGQTKLYDKIRSGRARPNVSVKEYVDVAWETLAQFILGQPYHGDKAAFAALLQHYGLPTHFVDLTEDPIVAAWFASNKLEQKLAIYIGTEWRGRRQFDYTRVTEGTGYVLVLGVDDPSSLGEARKLFDLAGLPKSCARPHAQKGWLLYDNPPDVPEPSDFLLATIALDLSQFQSTLRLDDVFPSPRQDETYARLLAAPFVQVPHFEDHSVLGSVRVVDVPEYNVDDLGPKWRDFTLFEPIPLREWQRQPMSLSHRYPAHAGADATIRDSTKIIFAPGAERALERGVDEAVPIGWPALDTNNLFFTTARHEHDKVVEADQPYLAVWLVRQDDLVIQSAIYVDVDERTGEVLPGHAFRLADGKLELTPMMGACECDAPEAHLILVRRLLSLQSLLAQRQLVIVPHGHGVINCYVVFHPVDDLKEALDGFKGLFVLNT